MTDEKISWRNGTRRIKPIKTIVCSKCEFNFIKVPVGYYDTTVTGICSICIVREKERV